MEIKEIANNVNNILIRYYADINSNTKNM